MDPNRSDSKHYTEFSATKMRINELDEAVDILKSRKSSCEAELFKIESAERKKYDSIYILEK